MVINRQNSIPFYTALTAVLKNYQEQHKLSKDDLANKCGLSKTTIYGMLDGVYRVRTIDGSTRQPNTSRRLTSFTQLFGKFEIPIYATIEGDPRIHDLTSLEAQEYIRDLTVSGISKTPLTKRAISTRTGYNRVLANQMLLKHKISEGIPIGLVPYCSILEVLGSPVTYQP